MQSTSEHRSKRFASVVARYRREHETEGAAVVALLVDVRHWCRRCDLKYGDLNGAACIQHALDWAKEHRP